MILTKPRKAILVAAVIAAISAAHYATDPAELWWHIAYQDLCYAPILVAAYWFGTTGGIITALVAGVGTCLHFHWQFDNTALVIEEYGQAVGFIITGGVGGLLASSAHRATERHQQALADLRNAHADLRESHEQLLRADRLSSLGEIAAGLAHEIGNPLAGVKGALEIIAARATPERSDREFSSLALREIARLERLVEEFLRFARPRDPRLSDVYISDVLDRVVSLIGREASDRHVSIDLQRTGMPSVSVDAEQMVQVFVNIVLNAVHASPAGSRVEIRIGSRDDMAAVDVCDEGPGIRPEHLDKIFDPFFSTKKHGTGLGLSISNRIVQSHGGRIEVEQPGKGTIMRVLLPLRAEASPDRPLGVTS